MKVHKKFRESKKIAENCEVVVYNFQKSGLSALIGEQLKIVGSLPTTMSVMIIAALVAALTEVTSNTATTTIIQPILKELVCDCFYHFCGIHINYMEFREN